MAFVNLSAEKVVKGQSVRGILSNRQIQCRIYLDKILCDPIGSGPPGVNKFSTNVGFFCMLTKHGDVKEQAMRASTATLVSSNCNLKCNLNYWKGGQKQLWRHKKHTKQNEGHAIAIALSGEVPWLLVARSEPFNYAALNHHWIYQHELLIRACTENFFVGQIEKW